MFCCFNKEFIKEIRRYLKIIKFNNFKVKAISQDIKTLKTLSRAWFVSPANSLGFMDGGVDKAYMEMYPTIQKRVKLQIAKHGVLSYLRRPFLPIGWVVETDCGCRREHYLISCPTMYLPQDVSETNNAYDCMLSIMTYMEAVDRDHKFKEDLFLICPSLCTGYGKMPFEKAAKQIMSALTDFDEGKRQVYEDLPSSNQPKLYMNKEFEIDLYHGSTFLEE